MAVNLIVARARLAGGASVASEAPESIAVDAGETIQVKFPFRFDEMSRRREDYSIHLSAGLDNEPPYRTMFEGKDHVIKSDDFRGLLLLEFTPVAAGQHVLHFEATARLDTSDWDGDETTSQEAQATGQVVIQVR